MVRGDPTNLFVSVYVTLVYMKDSKTSYHRKSREEVERMMKTSEVTGKFHLHQD
jgi:hypothetical protein